MITLDLSDDELILLQDAIDDMVGELEEPSDELLFLQVRLHALTGEELPPTRDESAAARLALKS